MLGLKIDPQNFELYKTLVTLLGEKIPRTGQSGLNGTFVVVEVDPKTQRQTLKYYDERDFREQFKFEGTVEPNHMATVVRIPHEQTN